MKNIRDEAGQTLILIAFASFALFAMVGLAIDAGRLYVTKAELSRSVDAAALSGIIEFDGTAAGLTAGVNKTYEYFDENEPGGNVTRVAVADGNKNEMTVDATKTVNLLFLPVLGIHTAKVSAHAKAGFGTQYLDTVMVLDATPSMAGNPIQQAVLAAQKFKQILLGTNPQGNVSVGLTAFRGCFRPSPLTYSDCVLTTGASRWVQGLTYSHSTLDTVLSNVSTASGGGNVGTNVCTGLAMGWNIVSGTGNHNDPVLYPDNRQFLILLSDGDNYYPGNNTYQDPYYSGSGPYDSNSSPTGTTVGGNVFPCQPIDAVGGSQGSPCPAPWNNPSISSTYPCYKGVFSPLHTIASDDFDGPSNNCPSTWNSGSGTWSGPWVASSSPAPTALGNDSSANDTRCHIRIPGTGSLCRAVDMTSVPGGQLYYYAKDGGTWDNGSDNAYVQISTSSNACNTGSGFTTERTHTTSGGNAIGTNYPSRAYQVNLDAYAGQIVYIRFQAAMSSTSDYFYIDTVEVQGGNTGSSDGFLNGNDSSSPQNCNTEQKPRERQLDVRTLQLASAIKAQGVEIFVVAFAGGVPNCYLDQNVKYDDHKPSDCGVITDNAAYPIGQSGPDGYTNSATPNPNVRLLQCIASSNPGTKDHYFYANDASELQGIFTQIASQIAHRLIE